MGASSGTATRVPFSDGVISIWTAERVARRSSDRDDYDVRYFRRTFRAAAGATLTGHISADSRYILWCNGQLVGRGPAKGDVAHQFYDTYDLTPCLRRGVNVLAAQVEHYSRVWPDYALGGPSVSQMTACPLFVFDGILHDAAGKAGEALHSDAQWRVLADTAYQHHSVWHRANCVPMQETFTAANYPWGFATHRYDDAAWAAATPVDRPPVLALHNDAPLPHRLLPRLIAPLVAAAPARFTAVLRVDGALSAADWGKLIAGRGTLALKPGQRAGAWLDAGALTTAFPAVDFAGNGRITLTYIEAAEDAQRHKARRDVAPAAAVPGQYDVVECSGAHIYEPFFWRTFRLVYVEVAAARGRRAGADGLALRDLTHRLMTYPFAELAQYDSSSPTTREVWDLCWRTARLCAHETYEDCPYYEQLQYAGDTQVQAMISYCVAGDASLARQFLYHMDWSRQPDGLTASRYPSRVPQVIPYWSLHWVMAVRDYYDYTGDLQTLRDLLPGVLMTMDYCHRQTQADGTIGRLRNWLVADWCPQWRDHDGSGIPPGALKGEAAYDSLIVAAALADTVALVRAAAAQPAAPSAGGPLAAAGLADTATRLQQRLDALRAAAHAKYFDDTRGIYQDRPLASDPHGVASAFTIAWANLAELPGDPAVMATRMVTDPSLCQLTYFSGYFAFRALAKAGCYELAPRLLAPWPALLDWGCTTVPETPELVTVRSECHAWGAGPLVEYTREILGVRPDAPGYAAIALQPKAAGLTFARGRVPLTRLHGDLPVRCVEVSWRRIAGRFELRATAPKGVPCVVTLPDGSQHQFPRGGKIVLGCPE